jgi:hypothetical protein
MIEPNPTISTATRIARPEDLLFTEVDGEAVLMSVENGRYYGLDPIGTEIWRRMEHPTRVAALIDGLRGNYDGDPDTIETEVLIFLNRMMEQELIEIHP